ncbi:retrovirus-related pol polyprotein from transposon TNT 1-94 [Tanacetum coccineum]
MNFPTRLGSNLFQLFEKGDDPIDAINHMMSFLTVVVNIPDKCAICSGETNYFAAGTTRKYTPGASGSNTGKASGTGHLLLTAKGRVIFPSSVLSRKRKRMKSVQMIKCLLVQDSSKWSSFNKGMEIGFWQIQDFLTLKPLRSVITTMLLIHSDDMDAFDSDCDELNQPRLPLMAKFFQGMALMHSLRKATSVPPLDPSPSSTTNKVEVPKEFPKVSMVNTSLKELKRHLAGFLIRVTKLVAENEHLKQTYKQLYDSIKPKRVQSKEQCDALIKQVNIKSGEIFDLNAKLQEQGLVIAALKNELRKLKGKALDNEDTVTHSVDPKVSKDNMEPITPKLLNKRTAHSSYIKHTQEEALVLRDIVEHVKANYPQDPLLESAFRYTKVIQDLLSHISRSCPSINNCGPQLIEVIPRKKDKKVRFAESLTSTENTKPDSTSNIVSNKRVLHSTGVRLSTSASGSQPSGNTKNDRILQTPSSNSKNKNIKNTRYSDYVCIHVIFGNQRKGVHSDRIYLELRIRPSLLCPNRSSGNLDSGCSNAFMTGDLLSALPNIISKFLGTVKFGYDQVAKIMVVQIFLWYLDSGCSKHMTRDRSQLTNFVNKFLGTVKFGNDHVAKIRGYGDYQIGNVTILRVYYVEGLGHNIFCVGQFCDSNLEVAFRQHTYYIRNLVGVDLLNGSRGDNLYTLSLGDMMASSPICLLPKASKTKSWLWHRRLSQLNFGAINHLARHGLIRGLPKLKFEKDHLCSACALGKSTKKPHKPKSKDTNQEKLYLLHMDLCGPMHVASVNGKKYILMIQVQLKETFRCIRTDNGTEFVNRTLREYYEKVGISYETSVARSPQQNGVVER